MVLSELALNYPPPQAVVYKSMDLWSAKRMLDEKFKPIPKPPIKAPN